MKRLTGSLLAIGLFLTASVLIAANIPEFRLASAKILVGDSSNLGQPVTMSGAATISNTGALTLATNGILSASLDKSVLQVTNCQLNVTQLEALRATPVTCIPAPAAGFAIVVHKAALFFDVTTTGETITGNNDDLAIEYSGGQDIMVIGTTGVIDQATDQLRIAYPNFQETVAAAANTACNTTCLGTGGACIAGWDQGTTVNVNCGSALADTCRCQGMVTPVTAQAVQLFNNGGGEWSAGNAANTLSIRMWWSLVPTVAFSSGG